ncbi:MAG TPA: hypothetical protein VHT34_06180 [Clostridia bacterium]|nr:hypothetical protein [Clostridia bacterium]
MKRKLFLLEIIFLLAATLSISLSLTACGKSKSPQPQAIQGTQQGEKVPEQLTSIENSIEKIIKTLKGPAVSQEGEQEQDKSNKKSSQDTQGSEKESTKQSTDKQGSDKQSSDKQSSDKSSDEKGGSDKQSSKDEEKKSKGQENQGQEKPENKQSEKPEDPWETIAPLINSMHYQWNSLMPMAAKKGADKTLIDSFSNGLNSLTNTIIGKNSTNTLMAASMLYSNIPDFYSLYRTSVSPEIKRIRYYTRNAMLNGYTSNWTQAGSDMNNLKAIWPLFKNTSTKETQDSYNKLDFSIYELDKAILEKNQPITDIKGRVAMSNIEALEKSMSKGSSGGQGGSQSQGSSGGGGSSSGENSSSKGSSSGGGSSGGGGS